jgi:hypothetical protein
MSSLVALAQTVLPFNFVDVGYTFLQTDMLIRSSDHLDNHVLTFDFDRQSLAELVRLVVRHQDIVCDSVISQSFFKMRLLR